MFLHDPFGFGHILFNMLTLWMFGADLERTWGSGGSSNITFFAASAPACVSLSQTCSFRVTWNPDDRRVRRDLRAAARFRATFIRIAEILFSFLVPDQGEVLRHDHRRDRFSEFVRGQRQRCEPNRSSRRHGDRLLSICVASSARDDPV